MSQDLQARGDLRAVDNHGGDDEIDVTDGRGNPLARDGRRAVCVSIHHNSD